MSLIEIARPKYEGSEARPGNPRPNDLADHLEDEGPGLTKGTRALAAHGIGMQYGRYAKGKPYELRLALGCDR